MSQIVGTSFAPKHKIKLTFFVVISTINRSDGYGRDNSRNCCLDLPLPSSVADYKEVQKLSFP